MRDYMWDQMKDWPDGHNNACLNFTWATMTTAIPKGIGVARVTTAGAFFYRSIRKGFRFGSEESALLWRIKG
jgi:hypothetical protein